MNYAFARLWVLGVLTAASGTAAAQASDYLRTVFENPHVRVVELLMPVGASLPGHVQPPGVRISAGKARFRLVAPDGSAQVLDYDPGQIQWVGEPERRTWTAVAGEAHVFFVEVKSAATGTVPAEPALAADHASRIDPEGHRAVIDNAHVRVLDGFGPAGAVSPPHSHPPTVLVSLSKSRFRVTIDGRTRVFDFEPYLVRWNNHFTHQWTLLAGEPRVVMVELKSADGDPAYKRRRR